MDPGVVALSIPIVAILSAAAVKVAKVITGNQAVKQDSESLDRLDGLEQELGDLRRELTETQERLDFAERLLAKGSRPDRLDPPAS